MKTRTLYLLLAMTIALALTGFASDANVGTWKLNEAKSKIPAGAPKNTMVTYTVAGDQFKCVVDGVDENGKPAHNEWTGKFDGKDYPLTGDPTADMRSVLKVDARHYRLTNKKAGKATANATIEFSPDGKTRTVTNMTKDAKGKAATATAIYDRVSPAAK